MARHPELLIPASSLEVLKTAVVFGADAVYIGGEAFGLRAKAKNFSKEDMMEGIRFAHEHDVKVYVTAKLWKVQSNVRISAEYSGTPAAGYQVESIMTTPNVISIAGSEDALASLKEQNNTIWLPGSVADISDRNSDFEEKINISDYLPDGLKLTSDSSEDVFVRVNILPEGSNVCEVPTKNIIVNDSPEGMQVSFDTAKIEIRVKKTSDDLADLTEGDIKASIDLKGMSEGSYEVPVSIEIPKGYELVDEVTTGVEISKISTADESN